MGAKESRDLETSHWPLLNPKRCSKPQDILLRQHMYQGTTLIVPSSLQAAFNILKRIWALAPAYVKTFEKLGAGFHKGR